MDVCFGYSWFMNCLSFGVRMSYDVTLKFIIIIGWCSATCMRLPDDMSNTSVTCSISHQWNSNVIFFLIENQTNKRHLFIQRSSHRIYNSVTHATAHLNDTNTHINRSCSMSMALLD